ncbi:glycosyltransferase family 2 protein [Marinovum sp. 2_MG-2023]|uniref:glycosyltransferase family 2 protein n=1 Tax=Roseobacteraceae TaxID=2854170 RepID=UPI001FD57FBF|nr:MULTISPECIES: glycosyltransferase family 2 protein [Roseobacteraceae]MCJ7872764.1 glycosyltransferase family 2 protein [Phaeobacter sp. J2-8]MDO6729984.1 glycosyltransferase family 2 protein [Marinovum sp. 2_MG-2023]MDO6779798.1 glycosyltransferase family 2 protein [Marinovum sp. 1_MG-2023]
MRFSSLLDFLARGKAVLAKGPVALILCEDDVEIASTLRHHQHLGFKTIVGFMPDRVNLPDDLSDGICRVDHTTARDGGIEALVNAVIPVAGTSWLYYCYNAEYLFYPFCETRTISEMLTFHAEERRDAMLTFVVDLYAQDLNKFPNAVSLDDAQIDRSGYYALARPDPKNHGHPKERQLDFHGGLRWRYEEHVPPTRRKIDRVSIFRAKPKLTMRPDNTFDDEEFNTYACPWHNNLTAVVASFRTAKALKLNAGSTFDIHQFTWKNSVPFEWHSRQLLDLGLMETGQWF